MNYMASEVGGTLLQVQYPSAYMNTFDCDIVFSHILFTTVILLMIASTTGFGSGVRRGVFRQRRTDLHFESSCPLQQPYNTQWNCKCPAPIVYPENKQEVFMVKT